MLKILVTGGAGYIGSHIIIELLSEGYEVIIFDNFSNSEKEVIDRIEKISGKRPQFEEIDLCDKKNLEILFNDYKNINIIIHLAALKAVKESIEKPLDYYRNNLNAILNILGMMKKYKIPNIVFSSSACVYGWPEKFPVDEKAPVKKQYTPYGNTKKIGEEIIQNKIRVNKFLKGIILRYFNVIGAHDSSDIGELSKGRPNNIVPFITQTAAGVYDKFEVFGDDYNTRDGTCVRDYIDVIDLAKAHILAAKRLINNKTKEDYEIFNLGTGKGYSVMELIKAFERVIGQKLNYKIVDRRQGDIEEIYADVSLAERELGWKAEKKLSDSLKSAWEWEKNYRNIKK